MLLPLVVTGWYYQPSFKREPTATELFYLELLPEFKDLPKEEPNCVVVGDAAEFFTYSAVNEAFQLLVALKDRATKANDPEMKSLLISMGKNKYYKENGALAIDLGAYTTALEFATDLKALIIGLT